MKGLVIALLLVLQFYVFFSFAAVCTGTTNKNPTITTPPTFIKNVTNGKLYRFDQLNPPLSVVHVYGTAYQMGYARGQLLGDEITKLIPQVFDYLYNQVGGFLSFLPAEIREFIEIYGVEGALELTALLTEAYTPQRYFDEMHGMADAVPGVTYSQIYQINMIPELIQASCSMFGAWGSAIKNTNGSLYQLRALDWSTSGPFQQFPSVTIYHPVEGDGHPFADVSWAGFVGSLTGFSSAPLGICEKVWLSYNGTKPRIGMPWTFVLRDILQYDIDKTSAINRIYNSPRTCSIFVGLGDYTNTFDVVEYSYEEVIVYDQKNFPVYQGHPKMEGLVYVDKHVQPSHDPCLGDLLQQYYGYISPDVIIANITAVFQTGDMHIAIYDFERMQMYVSNAGVYNPQTKYAQPAYDRTFARLDMGAMFAEKL